MKIRTANYVRTARNRWTVDIGRPTERVFRDDLRASSGENGFNKPDTVKINKPVDGYRKPSSYSCPALSKTQFNCDIRMEPTSIYDASGTQEMYFEGGMVGRVSVSSLGPNDHNVNNVRMKLLNNVRAEVFDVAMVLAEISGTANTLGTNLLRLARSLDQVKLRKPDSFWYLLTGKRRDSRRPTDRFLRESAGAFLEWKYGIMPTVYDIQGACKALDMNEDGSLFDNPPLLVARAVDRSTISRRSGRVTYTLPGSGGTAADLDIRTTVVDELKARLDYRVSGEGLRALNRYGLGLGTVATVAFDKTPFSFVLNMAVPIAELIKAWSALAGVEVVGYSETRYRRVDLHDSEVLLQQPWWMNDVQKIPAVVKKQENAFVDFERTAFAKVPMPLPFVRNPVKLGNIQTVLSLFTQLRSQEVYRR